ncbi:MAG: NADPH-dependent 7-cyano-7-deazaguanine reductase QueF [Luminiphilus sp.]|jgi:7-cyano-7-deazaguanine reductase
MAGVLGQTVAAPESYAPEVLERIARIKAEGAPEFGWDIWHAYELSWCAGADVSHAVGWLTIPADSPATVESKSLKLYLNSLNHHAFENDEDAVATIMRDVSACVGAPVSLDCLPVSALNDITEELTGVNLPPCRADQGLERIEAESLAHSPGKGNVVSEHLISHSLRSLCPVTAQPDWGSLSIRYSGQALDHASVSRYLSGYRSHQGFHEQCVDQIYTDLMTMKPESLEVAAFYQRRGGIDITPWRSSYPLSPNPKRLGRQ